MSCDTCRLDLSVAYGEIVHDAQSWRGWPVTIVPSKFDETSQLPRWMAFPAEANQPPMQAVLYKLDGRVWDVEDVLDALPVVGRGNTPDEALADMRKRIDRMRGGE